MFTYNFVQVIAQSVAEILVFCKNCAMHIKFDDCLVPVHGFQNTQGKNHAIVFRFTQKVIRNIIAGFILDVDLSCIELHRLVHHAKQFFVRKMLAALQNVGSATVICSNHSSF